MPHRIRASVPASAPRPASTVKTTRPHPVAWARALELAPGDTSRLSVDEDGSSVWVDRR